MRDGTWDPLHSIIHTIILTRTEQIILNYFEVTEAFLSSYFLSI